MNQIKFRTEYSDCGEEIESITILLNGRTGYGYATPCYCMSEGEGWDVMFLGYTFFAHDISEIGSMIEVTMRGFKDIKVIR